MGEAAVSSPSDLVRRLRVEGHLLAVPSTAESTSLPFSRELGGAFQCSHLMTQA